MSDRQPTWLQKLIDALSFRRMIDGHVMHCLHCVAPCEVIERETERNELERLTTARITYRCLVGHDVTITVEEPLR